MSESVATAATFQPVAAPACSAFTAQWPTCPSTSRATIASPFLRGRFIARPFRPACPRSRAPSHDECSVSLAAFRPGPPLRGEAPRHLREVLKARRPLSEEPLEPRHRRLLVLRRLADVVQTNELQRFLE